MCDYSLEMYASRPAREEEKYVTTRFPSGSIGLATSGDCTTAVCAKYDTHLKLENISADLQERLGVGHEEDVTFARLEHGAYRDGIRFSNGKEVSLQLLGAGVDVTLLPAENKSPGATAGKDVLVIGGTPTEPATQSRACVFV